MKVATILGGVALIIFAYSPWGEHQCGAAFLGVCMIDSQLTVSATILSTVRRIMFIET